MQSQLGGEVHNQKKVPFIDTQNLGINHKIEVNRNIFFSEKATKEQFLH